MRTRRIFVNTASTANKDSANTTNKMVYPELSFKVTGIAFKIQSELDRFCTERQEADALERELERLQIS